MTHYVRSFIRYLARRRGVARSSLRQYLSILKEFAKYNLTLSGLDSFLTKIQDQAPATKALKISVIRSYLNWLYETGKIRRKFWQDLRPPRFASIPRWLTPDEANALLNVSPEPYRSIFFILYRTGMRIGELERLNLNKDIFHDGNDLMIRIKGKGRKERILRVRKDLWPYLVRAKTNMPSRRDLQRKIKKIAEAAGLNKDVTIHALRHSAAMRLLGEGYPVTAIQSVLGHANLNTTAVYTKIRSEDIRL